MKDRQRLAIVRAVHPIVFAVMFAAAFELLYAGVTGAWGWLVWAALGLIAAEGVAFTANGLECPLSTMAVRYGAREGNAFDIFLSPRFAKVTFRLGAVVAASGTVLLALRWAGAIR